MSRAARKPPPADDLYETDFYLWTQAQAALLRARRFAELDLAHLVEEVESVGGSEKREIRNRLSVLIGHLLKWTYQPGNRSSGWVGTITEQRQQVNDILEMSPSLRGYPDQVFARAHLSGRVLAAKDTGIDFALFPAEPSFTVEQALDIDFLPAEPGLLDPS